MADLAVEVEKLVRDAPEGALEGERIKPLLARAKDEAARLAREGRTGREGAHLLSDVHDALMRALYEKRVSAADEDPAAPARGLALVALGGYGRRELAPASDLDVMVLSRERFRGETRERVAELFRALWDLGLDVGHSARTLAECALALGRDADSATALLEGRFLAGDADTFAEFRGALEAHFREHGARFVGSKFADTLERHAREGNSPFRMQPEVKNGPGGLRDAHTLRWIEEALRLAGLLPELARHRLLAAADTELVRGGADFILAVRLVLHSLAGRKQDRLDFEMQRRVAEAMGFAPADDLSAAEVFMREYFRAAGAIWRVLKVVMAEYEEERSGGARRSRRMAAAGGAHRRKTVSPYFVRVGRHLYLAREDAFTGEEGALRMMEAFAHAQRVRLAPSQEIMKKVRDALALVDERVRTSERAAHLFLGLLAGQGNVGEALRAMHASGLLGAYLPEFGELDCLVVTDVYHDYTVDEHSLRAVEVVDRLALDDPGENALARAIWRRVERTDLVKLAILLHDVGKSRGAGAHTERALALLPRAAERLGLDGEEARLLLFLVGEHMALARASEARDLSEPGLCESFAERMDSAARLDMLWLVTYADLRAVGRGALPGWKAEVLEELYRRVRAALEAAPSAREPGAMLAELSANPPEGVSAEAVAEHLAFVPPRYELEVPLEHAARHVALVARLAREGATSAVDFGVTGGRHVDFFVAGTDRPRRFAQIAGAFAAHAVSIVSARAYTRTDGVIIDEVRVAAEEEDRESGEGFWRGVAGTLTAIMTGEKDVAAFVAAARRRVAAAPELSHPMEPRVAVDNRVSPTHSVVDVVCGDRVGLLWSMASALSDASLDIAFARVSTLGGVVTDVFYVTRQDGSKLEDAAGIEALKARLAAACTAADS